MLSFLMVSLRGRSCEGGRLEALVGRLSDEGCSEGMVLRPSLIRLIDLFFESGKP